MTGADENRRQTNITSIAIHNKQRKRQKTTNSFQKTNENEFECVAAGAHEADEAIGHEDEVPFDGVLVADDCVHAPHLERALQQVQVGKSAERYGTLLSLANKCPPMTSRTAQPQRIVIRHRFMFVNHTAQYSTMTARADNSAKYWEWDALVTA